MSNSASVWRTYLLAAVVALGLSAVWALAVVYTISIAESASRNHGVYEQIYVAPDGEPVILRHTQGVYAPLQEVETLAGEAAQVDTRSLLNPMYTNRPANDAVWPTTQSRLAAVNDGGSPRTYWYLFHDGQVNGRAYGVGYDSLTQHVAGYFGRNGFADRLPPRSEWFEIAGRHGLAQATPSIAMAEPQWVEDHVLYWLADGKLWSADPAERTVRALVDAPRDGVVGWAWDLSKGPRERPVDSYVTTGGWAPRKLLLRTEDTVTLVDPQTAEDVTYSIPPSARRATLAGFHLPDGNLLLVTMNAGDDPPTSEVMWLNPQSVVRREEVRLTQWGTVGSLATIGWISAAVAPLPAGQAPMFFLLPFSLLEQGRAESYWGAVAGMLGYTWPGLLVVAMIGAAAAASAFRRQQRFGLPHAMGWAVFAFFFGAPGWIAYRFHRTWPVLEECPACGQLAPHDRDRCAECLAPFPPPARKGIEVFA